MRPYTFFFFFNLKTRSPPVHLPQEMGPTCLRFCSQQPLPSQVETGVSSQNLGSLEKARSLGWLLEPGEFFE